MQLRSLIRGGACLLVCLPFASAPRGVAQGEAGSAPPVRPQIRVVRSDEDWSALRDPALRTDWLDRLKYIPIGPEEEQYLSIGGEFRGTYERVQNDDWTAVPYGLNSFGLERYLLHVDAHLNEQVRIFVQLESGFEHGRPGGPRPIDEKRLDFLSAFLQIRPTHSTHAPAIRIGKQELQFGAGRLVSVREGPNVRQGFFGFRVDQDLGRWQATGFAVRPAQDNQGFFNDGPVGGVGFWGATANRFWQRFQHYEFNSYYFGLDQKAATFNRGTAHEVRQTLGGRLAIDPPKQTGERRVLPHLDVESIYQFGSFGSEPIRAWGVATETSLLFPRAPLRPRIGLRADTSSGDHNAADGTLRTYNPLFPIGNYFGIFADTGPGPSNFRDLHPAVLLAPSRHVGVTADDVIWWRASLGDGVYDVPGHLLVAAGTSKARFVGHRPGVETRWQIDRHAYVQADYGVFLAGPFLRQSGRTHNLSYTSVWLGYKF